VTPPDESVPSTPMAPGWPASAPQDLPVEAGWRSRVRTALALSVGDPVLWLYGLLGFAARGGVLVIALPILTIPSPVLLTIYFRGDLTTTGLSASAPWLGLAAALAFGAAVLVGLLVSAWADVAAFDRAVHDPETDPLRAGTVAGQPSGPRRRGLVMWVAAIEAAGLVPILLGALAVAMLVPGAVVSEVQTPTSTAVPLVDRVVNRIGPELLVLVVVALLADVCVSLATRHLLAARYEVGPRPRDGSDAALAVDGAARLVRQPARSLGVACLAWLVTLLLVVPIVIATVAAWAGLRDIISALGGASAPAGILTAVIAVLVFAAVWIAGLVLVGFGASLRAALWTTDALA
jgi:hypothetical protein